MLTIEQELAKSKTLKLSKFIVAKEGVDGFVLLFSSRSGALLSLSDTNFANLKAGCLSMLSSELLQGLMDNGFLVNEGQDEIQDVLKENKASAKNSSTLYEVIMPSAWCQLGCDYCGQEHKTHQISKENQNSIVSRIRHKIKSGRYKALKVGWFGGEPLTGIKAVRELTVLLKSVAEENNIIYSAKMVTNGVSLSNEVIDELQPTLGIDRIEVTLDGHQEEHDRRRVFKSGQGSYQKILNNLVQLSQRQGHKVSINIRCNVDRRNIDSVATLLEDLAQRGLQRYVSFYAVRVYPWGNDVSGIAVEAEEFARQELDWFLLMAGLGFQLDLLPTRNQIVCLAVNPHAEVVDPYGVIHNCTEKPLVPLYREHYGDAGDLVSVSDIRVNKTDSLSNWNDELQNGVYQCTNCELLPACGGRCPKQWKEGNMACPSIKWNIQDRMLLTYYYELAKHQIEMQGGIFNRSIG